MLMLIDNSGSMTKSDLITNVKEEATYGDGSSPHTDSKDNILYNYFGKDVYPANNRVALGPDGEVDYNYHPRLVYIPQKFITQMETEIQQKVRNGWPNYNLSDRFASYNAGAGDLSPDEIAEMHEKENGYYSIYKYPNDSRMYILKNVMWRLLHDEAIFGGLRIAFAAYHHKYASSMEKASGNYVDLNASGSGRNKKWDWTKSVELYWNYSGVSNRGMLLEPFRLATADPDYFDDYTSTYGNHIDNLREWFSGENVAGRALPETEYSGQNIVREFRADTWTPLANSIYDTGQNASSALQYFNAKDVITDYCQQNWLIALTDGEDNYENRIFNDVPKAVENLCKQTVGNNSANQKIKAFIIGFVNPDKQGQQNLVNTLNNAAKKGGTEKAYFAANMEQLFTALRQIFSEIQEAAGITGGSPMIAPPSGPEEESVVYLPSHDPMNGRQWKGYFRKNVRKTRENGDSYYEEAWEASKELDEKSWNSRSIYTAYQGLTAIFNNLCEFKGDKASALRTTIGLKDNSTTKDFINWLRGENVYELDTINSYEVHKLYDINHSGISYVGSPIGGVLGEEYASFRNSWKGRRPLVYVQSNAGMLHAFDDKSGEEIFAFIPPNVLSEGRLAGLRVKDGKYSDNETSYSRYLLNGPLATEDVHLSGGYRTLLLGLLGPGGPGFYAMDVTNPSSPSMLWAIENSIYETGADEPKMAEDANEWKVLRWKKSSGQTLFDSYAHTALDGHEYDYRLLRRTISKPAIGRVRLGSTTPDWKWIFLMGSGFAGSISGDKSPGGALFAGNVEDGSIIQRFAAEAPVTSHVIAVRDKYDSYGELKDIVAGDSSGTVYKADLSDVNSGNWKMSAVLKFPGGKAGGIFRGLNAFHIDGKLWLCAGSGEVMEFIEKETSSDSNYFAAVNITTPKETPYLPSDLDKLSANDGADDGSYEVNPQRTGWYLELESKEKSDDREVMATTPLLYRNRYVIFFTFIPDSSDKCAENGDSRLYMLNLKTGAAPESWGKKYKEFKGIKVTGAALLGDNLAVSATLLKSKPGLDEDEGLRESILEGEIPNLHENEEIDLQDTWEFEMTPAFWRAR
ncbi:MAG: hypothetical protein GX181_04510 [Synergistaceae bacterium]|nr:hypothetical protein [Synergistaceae bacterium]